MKAFHVPNSLLTLASNYLNIQIPKNVRNNVDKVMDFLNLMTDALSLVFVLEHLQLTSLHDTKGFLFFN